MISIIAALQKKDRGIGYHDDLLSKISDDLKRFKSLTSGHPIIMGRKTFESLGKKPLPDRTNIIITRDLSEQIADVTYCTSIQDAISCAQNIDREIFIIGGGEIYRQTLPLSERLYLTLIESDMPADTFFPPYDEFKKKVSEENHVDEKSGLAYSFLTLEK
jgi:dihydrofolate reductase